MSVNKAILVGRLGKDPELRYTPNGRAVASFPLATDRRWKGQDGQQQSETTWHNIVAWGRQAEVINEYMSKGRQLYIEGRISNRSYDDKDGNKRWISEVVVENFTFLGDRGDSGGGGSRESAAAPGAPEEPQSAPPQGEASDDDDLPF